MEMSGGGYSVCDSTFTAAQSRKVHRGEQNRDESVGTASKGTASKSGRARQKFSLFLFTLLPVQFPVSLLFHNN